MTLKDRLLKEQNQLLKLGLENGELEYIDEDQGFQRKIKCTKDIFQYIASQLIKAIDYDALEKGYVDFWFEYIPFLKCNSAIGEVNELDHYIYSNLTLGNGLDDILDPELLGMFCRSEGVMFVQIDKYSDDDIHYYRYYFRVNLDKCKVRVKTRDRKLIKF